MRSLSDIRANTKKTEIFRGQVQHTKITALTAIGTCSLPTDNGGSFPGVATMQIIAGVLLMGLIGWTMHSVLKYFTINRALGGDHFFDEYLNMPKVDQGAFQYSADAMYTFVFAGLWGIGLLLGSWNALVLALFYHAYIWVHMYCTEDPDMRILYSDS